MSIWLRIGSYITFCLALSSSVWSDQGEALRDKIVGRTAIFKIDMPVYKGVVLMPDGRLDEKSYYKRLKKHRPAFNPGERAEITKVLIEKSALKICFNGCGVGFIGPGSRIVGKLDRIGTSISVSFPGPVTSEDADPDKILAVIGGVAVVEGIQTASTRQAPEPAPVVSEQSGSPTLELLSVTVEPAEVHRGDSIGLIIQFEVSGAGQGLPVTEERQIYQGDVALMSQARSATETWPDGRQKTSVVFRVPETSAAGAYTFEGVVRGAGGEHKARAVFLVRE